MTVSSLRPGTERTRYMHAYRKYACGKGEVISVCREKILHCKKRDRENFDHIIRNLVILNEEFYMEKFRTVTNWS